MKWLRDFLFEAQPAEFASSYTVQESVRRLSEVTGRSFLSALTKQKAVGTVSEARVSLQRVIPFVGNSFKPFFVGSFRSVAGRTVLVGRFTMARYTKVFMSVWFGFCFLWTVLATLAVIRGAPSDLWWFPFAGVGMITAGALFVALAKRLARNDVRWLSEVIRGALNAAA